MELWKKELYHHGIPNQRWGVRNGPPYPLDEKTRRRIERRDFRWARRNERRITRSAEQKVKKEITEYERNVLRKSDIPKYNVTGRINRYYASAYSKELARLMNSSIEDIPAPSGRVVRFVAKRGEMGVYMALADPGYNMNTVRNGVYNSGKIAYRNENVGVATYEDRRR